MDRTRVSIFSCYAQLSRLAGAKGHLLLTLSAINSWARLRHLELQNLQQEKGENVRGAVQLTSLVLNSQSKAKKFARK